MPYKYELPAISEKQEAIIVLVFRFRFMNRWQLQRLFSHKDPRRINAWLKDLVAKGYLGRIYSHKLLENTKPAIYYLNNNGITLIQLRKGEAYNGNYLETQYVKKFYQDKKRSQTFIGHCLAVAELYVLLTIHEQELNSRQESKANNQHNKTTQHIQHVRYAVETKTEIWLDQQFAEELEETKETIPDLFIERITETKNTDE